VWRPAGLGFAPRICFWRDAQACPREQLTTQCLSATVAHGVSSGARLKHMRVHAGGIAQPFSGKMKSVKGFVTHDAAMAAGI